VETTATAGKRFADGRRLVDGFASRFRRSFWLKPGVRARQIALITLLVSLVVLTTTVANIAYMTGVIVKRTADQASQLSNQIIYAVQQEFAQNPDSGPGADSYAVIAGERSGVRGMMESLIAIRGPITYLYLTDGEGRVITDRNGRNDLALNEYMMQRPSYDLRKLNEENAYIQLGRLFLGPTIYDFREPLPSEGPIEAIFTSVCQPPQSAGSSALRSRRIFSSDCWQFAWGPWSPLHLPICSLNRLKRFQPASISCNKARITESTCRKTKLSPA